jgi:hypothetical protein
MFLWRVSKFEFWRENHFSRPAGADDGREDAVQQAGGPSGVHFYSSRFLPKKISDKFLSSIYGRFFL